MQTHASPFTPPTIGLTDMRVPEERYIDTFPKLRPIDRLVFGFLYFP